MAASLATQYYQLGKYAPNDLTDYLTTYNGTMDKIDTAIHAAQDAADTAQAQADANLNNINALSQNLAAANKNVENLSKTQTAHQAEIDNLQDLEYGNFMAGSSLSGGSNVVGLSGTVELNLRSNKISLLGFAFAKFNDSAKTPNPAVKRASVPRTSLGSSEETIGLAEVFYISGNPFSLTAGIKTCRLDVFTTENQYLVDLGLWNSQMGYYEYDQATKTTRFYIDCGTDSSYVPQIKMYAFRFVF